MKKCPYCGAQLEDDENVCHECGKEQPINVFVNPFNDDIPVVQKFFLTVKEILFSPVKFFQTLDKDTKVLNSFFYYFVILIISSLFSSVYSKTFLSKIQQYTQQFAAQGGSSQMMQSIPMQHFGFIFVFLRGIILGAIGVFIGAAIYHVVLMILGEGQYGFENSLKAILFGNTPNLLMIIPFCGAFIGAIWSLVVTIIALANLQETSYGKAAVAVFAIFILCCLTIVGFGILGAGIAGAMGGMAN